MNPVTNPKLCETICFHSKREPWPPKITTHWIRWRVPTCPKTICFRSKNEPWSPLKNTISESSAGFNKIRYHSKTEPWPPKSPSGESGDEFQLVQTQYVFSTSEPWPPLNKHKNSIRWIRWRNPNCAKNICFHSKSEPWPPTNHHLVNPVVNS